MAYNAASFSEFVDNVERVVLDQLEDAKPSMVRSLFTSVPWQEGDGEKVTFNSVALSGFALRVNENENYTVVNPSKGNELEKTQIQYGDKLEITRRMMKFNNRYVQAKFAAEDLVSRLMNVLDLEMTLQAFSEVDQTTFTPAGQPAFNIATSDSQPVASAAHVYGGVTFSNLLDDAAQGSGPVLNKTNLTTALNQMTRNTPDDFGTNITPDPDTVVIANDFDMIIKAHELFGSSLTPETSNNAVNYFGGTGKLKVVSLKYGDRNTLGQTGTDNIYRWAVLDSNMTRRSWQLMMAEDPTPEQKFLDHDNILAKILVTQFASFAIVQPQGSIYSLSTTKPTLS